MCALFFLFDVLGGAARPKPTLFAHPSCFCLCRLSRSCSILTPTASFVLFISVAVLPCPVLSRPVLSCPVLPLPSRPLPRPPLPCAAFSSPSRTLLLPSATTRGHYCNKTCRGKQSYGAARWARFSFRADRSGPAWSSATYSLPHLRALSVRFVVVARGGAERRSLPISVSRGGGGGGGGGGCHTSLNATVDRTVVQTPCWLTQHRAARA